METPLAAKTFSPLPIYVSIAGENAQREGERNSRGEGPRGQREYLQTVRDRGKGGEGWTKTEAFGGPGHERKGGTY